MQQVCAVHVLCFAPVVSVWVSGKEHTQGAVVVGVFEFVCAWVGPAMVHRFWCVSVCVRGF